MQRMCCTITLLERSCFIKKDEKVEEKFWFDQKEIYETKNEIYLLLILIESSFILIVSQGLVFVKQVLI